MESKFLSYLSVSPEQYANFPDDLKEFVRLIDGSQELYSKSPEGVQKDKLGIVLVQWTTAVMKYLQQQDLGIYANKNVERENHSLPKEVKPMKPEPPQPEPPKPEPPQPPKTETPPPPPPDKPKRRERKPKETPPPTPPDGGTPPPSDEPAFTREEVEATLTGLEILALLGDEEAKEQIPAYQYLLTTM